MPRFRPDLDGLLTYVPGRPIEDVAREIGIGPEEIVKLASNESPDGPFPGVADAVLVAALESNRYPDNDAFELTRALADFEGVAEENLWLGAGSTGILGCIAYGLGGPGTSAVYAWPSFVMYRIISRWSMTESIEVGLDEQFAHDLDAMVDAIRDDTTVVYICNPNNPTGTTVSGDAMDRFLRSIPDHALVVVDEAYHHFVDDPDYRSSVATTLERPNVVVLRTLSKVFALAGHRVGYAIGHPGTLDNLKRTQAPFTVGVLAQAAALASLPQTSELKRRVDQNREGRRQIEEELASRGVPFVPSQANFVYMKPGAPPEGAADSLLSQGIVVRPMSRGWIRVTVGTPEENQAFLHALERLGGPIAHL
jgi:histidinol-phosphate aminotransferase